MNEEKEAQEIQEQAKGEEQNTTEESSNLVDKATLAAERLEKANKEKEALLAREEALFARKKLSGETSAGYKVKPKSEEEKWAEEAKIRYAGTGLDPTPDDSPTTYG